MPIRSEAQLSYNFIDEESGNVLATLELDTLPATDIAGLTFTAEGQELLELGPNYSGTFETIDSSLAVDDGTAGLVCTGGDSNNNCGWVDRDPPAPSVPGTWGSFAILIGEEGDEPDRLAAGIPYAGGKSGGTHYYSFATGSFQLAQIPGDFNNDGYVDGLDFLQGQRNPGVGSLAEWQANYGNAAALSATSVAVPEPTTSALVLATLCLSLARRRFFHQSSDRGEGP